MSTVVVLAPIIVGNWPVIAAAVGAAVGTMGFSALRHGETEKQEDSSTTREEINVENSEILPSASGAEESMVVEREGVAQFFRDARGGLRLCVEGDGHSRSELRRIGEELLDRVTQQYVYHRVVTELKEHRMTIVSEEVAEDRTVKIRVRSW